MISWEFIAEVGILLSISSLNFAITRLVLQGVEERPPIVVLAHGIAGQKDMGLHPFAEVFAQRGLAVLVFDYRNFGGSEGEPRNWVSPKRHLEDWDAALDYVRVRPKLTLPQI